ncbi:DUF4158 domain-containing protein [Streptomyces hydrogenans]|uniref:DUF4158 domain-containing protein n=1 Tax=Streptomyces hydrogenans TaxID=1873719 RepID=UPI00380253B3
MERFFFLDDADREKVQAKRRAHNRLGFAVQLTTVRFLGLFMPDPQQVPAEVAEYLAGCRVADARADCRARADTSALCREGRVREQRGLWVLSRRVPRGRGRRWPR